MSDATVKDEKAVAKDRAELAVERKVEPLKELSFQEHGWKQMHYDAIAAAGITPEDVLKRDYWAHVAQRSLRSMTKISIMAEDRSWYGEMICFQTFQQGALVAFIHPPVLLNKAGLVREESEYEVFDGGLSKDWCVRRMKDGRIIKDGCASKAEAEMFLSNWLKSQGTPRRAA